MDANEPEVREILSRSKVVCIATLSKQSRPSIHPIYFILNDGKIWIGTPEWTVAVRNVKANPEVVLLLNVEQNIEDRRVLHIRGDAVVRTEPNIIRRYSLGVVRKYILTPRGLFSWLTHPRQAWLRRYYTAQSRQKGKTCIIEVTPKQVEIMTNM